MAIKLQLQPSRNITLTEDSNHWEITSIPAHMKLLADHHPIPSGWVLLRGQVLRQGSDYSARLIAITDQEIHHVFSLPISFKGTLLELIYLPKGCKQLVFEPMRSLGSFEIADGLYLQPVSWAERIFRMIQRVLPVYAQRSRARRVRAGLRSYTPFMSLKKAYNIAGTFRTYSPAPDYDKWIEKFEKLSISEAKHIQNHMKKWHKAPQFTVLITLTGSNSTTQLQRTLNSLKEQLYQKFHIIILCAKQVPSNIHVPNGITDIETISANEHNDIYEHLEASKTPSWFICIQAGVHLTKHALYYMAHNAIKQKRLQLMYTDHDQIDHNGLRHSPVFKPDWSLELLRSHNYINCSVTIRSSLLLQTKELNFFNQYDVLLKITERLNPKAIFHIPAVLYHLPPQSKDTKNDQGTGVILKHLQRLNIKASVTKTAAGCNNITYSLPTKPPMISIIVPTFNAPHYLKQCIESVLNISTYKNYELIIVDNRTVNPSALTYLSQLEDIPHVRVLKYDFPFNYSAINNFASGTARGDVLCLLNNDTQVITPNWMEIMLGHLMQSNVGIVGAKLYYKNNRIQHAGDIIGVGGCAQHLHSGLKKNDPGYCNRAAVAQNLTAVTGACMLTWKRIYDELDGLDAVNLPISFNDTDYCMRVRKAGYHVVWTPYAELYHYESVSRGKNSKKEDSSQALREVKYMRKSWKHMIKHDPFYNPNLSYERPDFSLSHTPIKLSPWKKHRAST